MANALHDRIDDALGTQEVLTKALGSLDALGGEKALKRRRIGEVHRFLRM
jgi:hypothetical protein